MNTFWTVLFIILVVVVAIIAALYFFGRKMQRRQAEQEKQIKAASQTVSMYVIDKKKMKLKDAKFPAVVLEQTPKYMRGIKMPIVRAKVGPQISSFICDAGIFNMIPEKKTIKATISGLYITAAKGERGAVLQAPPKQGLMTKLKKKISKK